MPAKDYYLILGVPRTETAGGIRAAYRALARRLHPDHGGDGATQAFQEINEAYEVLSDPGRRRAHNHSLRASEERAARAAPVPVRRRRAPTEPLVPQPKVERIEGLDMDLVLTAEEAARGLLLRVRVQDEEVVSVRIPSGVRTGTVVEIPLAEPGVQNLVLRFHVSVTGPHNAIPLW